MKDQWSIWSFFLFTSVSIINVSAHNTPQTFLSLRSHYQTYCCLVHISFFQLLLLCLLFINSVPSSWSDRWINSLHMWFKIIFSSSGVLAWRLCDVVRQCKIFAFRSYCWCNFIFSIVTLFAPTVPLTLCWIPQSLQKTETKCSFRFKS